MRGLKSKKSYLLKARPVWEMSNVAENDYIYKTLTHMPNPPPHWHPDADFAHVSFFIRRMNTSGFIKPDKVPQAVLPGMGFIYLTGGEILVEADSRPYLCAAGHLLLIPDKVPFAILHYSDAIGFTGMISPLLMARSGGSALSLLIARIGRAKELLGGSQDSVIDIAAAVGLEDQSYFSRFFRRHTGMTPSEYRRKMQG